MGKGRAAYYFISFQFCFTCPRNNQSLVVLATFADWLHLYGFGDTGVTLDTLHQLDTATGQSHVYRNV